eukprot:CAMPEP_0180431570 /NCGR_PEP_ID=MMETSP1036_2-20121128/8466_1 /TAXON_ID=632150 /ORGANISM="Azadinium spinosum, Strain 3D9" /LENGTH=106 /DNA_ID=CAMNT_0022437333 /DNA_START=491 /DNA_END=812 /DNA_ORIENTATION=+
MAVSEAATMAAEKQARPKATLQCPTLALSVSGLPPGPHRPRSLTPPPRKGPAMSWTLTTYHFHHSARQRGAAGSEIALAATLEHIAEGGMFQGKAGLAARKWSRGL